MAIACDLSLMDQTRRAIDAFLSHNQGLDFLFLNANSICHERRITWEGFESNFALCHLSRALMAWELDEALRARPRSQVLTSVGLNVSHLDFVDLTMERSYSSMSALGRGQWAAQVFAREFSRRSSTAMNIYMPGLVRTKMLKSPGWPIGMIAKALSLVVGLPVDRAAANVFTVLNEVSCSGKRGLTYVWTKPRNLFDLKLQPGDPERLWDVTAELLRPYR